MLLYFCFCKQINNNMAKRYGCFPQYVMGPSYKCRVYRAVVPAGHGCVGMGWGAAVMERKPRRGYSLVEMRVRVASRPAGTDVR